MCVAAVDLSCDLQKQKEKKKWEAHGKEIPDLWFLNIII
jgi:hypothetical protein